MSQEIDKERDPGGRLKEWEGGRVIKEKERKRNQ